MMALALAAIAINRDQSRTSIVVMVTDEICMAGKCRLRCYGERRVSAREITSFGKFRSAEYCCRQGFTERKAGAVSLLGSHLA